MIGPKIPVVILVTCLALLLVIGTATASDFNSTWDTAKTSPGSTNSTAIKLPLEAAGTYNFIVNWGDSTSDTITVWDQANVTHGYSSGGTYDISINGTITGFRFNNAADKLKILNIANWGDLNLGISNGAFFYGCSNLKVSATDTLNLTGTTTFHFMFLSCTALTTLDVSSWDTSKVTSFRSAFFGCTALTTLDVSSWNTSKVTTFYQMFYSCPSLTTLDTSSWNTREVTTVDHAFYSCSALTTLDVSSWNTSKVTTFQSAFLGCTALTTLDTSSWNTSKVTTFQYAFDGCSGLTTLDTSSWNTSKVTTFRTSFRDCTALTTLDTSSWNTSKVTTFLSAFDGCSALTTVTGIGSLNVTSVSDMSNMFSGVTLTTVNYNSLLNGWASLPSLQNGVTFDAGNSEYNPTLAGNSRDNILIGNFGWTITDGGINNKVPPAPTNLLNSTGNFWVNYTWSPGTGNITDLYNVSYNGSWDNTSSNTYRKETVGPHGYLDIIVYAYNNSGGGIGNLSVGSLTDNVTVPNNAPVITDTGDSEISVGETVSVDYSYTDLDGDLGGTFSCSRTDLFADFNTATGVGTWTVSSGDKGTYLVDFGVADGYGGTDNYTMTIIVNSEWIGVTGDTTQLWGDSVSLIGIVLMMIILGLIIGAIYMFKSGEGVDSDITGKAIQIALVAIVLVALVAVGPKIFDSILSAWV